MPLLVALKMELYFVKFVFIFYPFLRLTFYKCIEIYFFSFVFYCPCSNGGVSGGNLSFSYWFPRLFFNVRILTFFLFFSFF